LSTDRMDIVWLGATLGPSGVISVEILFLVVFTSLSLFTSHLNLLDFTPALADLQVARFLISLTSLSSSVSVTIFQRVGATCPTRESSSRIGIVVSVRIGKHTVGLAIGLAVGLATKLGRT
jgi:hypothetical protein